MLTLVRVWFTVALLWTAASPVFGGVKFTSPPSGRPASGPVVLSVVSTKTLSRVEFRMGSYRLGVAHAAPFSIIWNSAEATDGTSEIEAIGYDSAGNWADFGSTLLQISNRHVSLNVIAPDLGQPLRGIIALQATGSDADAWPAIWTLNIDGEEQSTVWTDNTWKSPLTVNFKLDTTRFPNGLHELHLTLNSRTGPNNPQWVNWRGMVNRVIDIENGHSRMDIQPASQNVYLQPGQSVNVGCSQLYTDDSHQACSAAQFQTQNSNVAKVDATGTVTATGAGFTRIAIQSNALSTFAQVWVVDRLQLPHFSGSGKLLNAYDSSSSLFPIAPFYLEPDQITQSPALQDEIKQSGVNALGFGVYLNPRSLNATYSDWQASFDTVIQPKMTWARDNGYHLLLTGDDIFRQIGTDAWYTLNWPPAQQAVRYAASQLASTGVGIAIEGIDEASMLWGPRPNPLGKIGSAPYLFDRIDCQGITCTAHWPSNPVSNGWQFALRGANAPPLNTAAGSIFTARNSTGTGFDFDPGSPAWGSSTASNDRNLEFLWFSGRPCSNGSLCNPPVPNNALATMRSWLRGTVPVAFPPVSTAGPTVYRDWVGIDGISDYASHYFTSLKVRTTYPWSEGTQEMVTYMQQEFYARQPYMLQDRPQLMLVSLAGPSYTKVQPQSATYQAGSDILDQPGVSPQHVSALMMTSAALGGAGIRLYYFEAPSNLQNRVTAKPGAFLQTGSNPENLQAKSWQAMSYAANLLTKVLQPYLLDTRMNSPAYGRNIVTAARTGTSGNMLLLVNGNDWPRTVTVDLSPYLTGSATRYQLHVDGLDRQPLPASQTNDKVTLGAGESLAYVFEKK